MVPGDERDLVQLRRGREHRAVRRRPRSPEEARDDAAGRLRSPRHLGGRSVLLGRVSESSEIFADFPGEAGPRNLSHLDRSVAVALAPGGDTVLFNEMGQSDRSVYLRRTDGSPPKRLADGYAWALSPDGKFALVGPRPGPEMWLVPTGPGQPRLIATPGLRRGGRMGFFPDGRRVWFMAEDPAHTRRAWGLDLWRGEASSADASGGWRDDSVGRRTFSLRALRPMATGHSIQRRRRKHTRSSAFFPARSRSSGPRTGGSIRPRSG